MTGPPSDPSSDDFFVEDEPLEEVIAAFEQGVKHLTSPPYDWVDDPELSLEETLVRLAELQPLEIETDPHGTGWCAPSP